MLPDLAPFFPTATVYVPTTTVNITVPNAIATLGVRSTAGWGLTGAPIIGVEVTTPTNIAVTKSGLAVPTEVSYGGADPTLVDAAGNPLGTFSLPIPFP